MPSLSAINTFLRDSFRGPYQKKRLRRMNLFISFLVFINVALIMVATIDSLHPLAKTIIHSVNAGITVIFAIEYILRMRYSQDNPVKFALRFTSIVDVISIYPALLSMIFGWHVSHMTFLRLLRVVKFFRTTKTAKLFKQMLKRTYRQLLFSFSMIGIVILAFSALLYYAEGTAQPKVFSNIFDCIWWTISALTTSGYISVYPITLLGKVISSLTVILGISLFAVPAGIITAGFIEEYKTSRGKRFNQPPEEEKATKKAK